MTEKSVFRQINNLKARATQQYKNGSCITFSMIKIIKTTLVVALVMVATGTGARTLPQILQDGLASAPDLAEARANERIANSRLEQTEAARWPVVSVTGGQRLLTTKKSGSKSFVPTLRSSWTIYDFGQNEAATERDKFKVGYYNHKTAETAEELIYQLSGFYLEALKAHMSLKVANDNKTRHEEIVRMLNIIVEYDPGRRFELTQAKSRLLQVESDITNYQRSLGLSLLRLARYVEPAVTIGELSNPFKIGVSELVSRYSISEEDLRTHPSYVAQKEELSSIAADLTAAERARWPSLNLVGMASEKETTVYMNFDVDVFNKVTSPAISEKKHQIEAAQAQLKKIQRNLTERARLAELKMFQDQSRLFIADNQIKELKQVALDYEDQFSIAQRSLLDVVNAYRELASIDLFKAETNYDLMMAKLDYLSAVGALREWAGVGEKGIKDTAEKNKNTLKTIDFDAQNSNSEISVPETEANTPLVASDSAATDSSANKQKTTAKTTAKTTEATVPVLPAISLESAGEPQSTSRLTNDTPASSGLTFSESELPAPAMPVIDLESVGN